MINTNETIPPQVPDPRKINAAETIAPGGAGADTPFQLMSGEAVAGSYIIDSMLSTQGKQSDVYLAKRWGKSYVVKVYREGWKASQRMRDYLLNVRHPNIAHIVECGEYLDRYYEIYEYFPEGSLEKVTDVSAAHIRDVIIPSLNEGLNELHKHGIVHCDIKPANLFYADNRNRVVIGDCGISGFANSGGKLVDAVRGTPEYAPRVRSLLWSAAMSPAYDYGSFGLVLCRMILGRSLFAGMSLEEISRAWERGIELPSRIEGRFATLIKALITEDEEKRWGYIEVKRWGEGEFMRPVSRNLYSRASKERSVKPLIFGRFDGQTLSVTSLHQLANAIKAHWQQATVIVKRRDLIDFVQQFDKALPAQIRPLALYHDEDAAVFELLSLLEDAPTAIYYCGREYPDLAAYVNALSSGRDQVAVKFMFSGLLVSCLRKRGYEQSQVDRLEQLIRKSTDTDMSAICTICFSLQDKKSIAVFGKSVDSMDSLVSAIAGHSVEEIAALLVSDMFKAWLFRMGYEKELKYMNEIQGM